MIQLKYSTYVLCCILKHFTSEHLTCFTFEIPALFTAYLYQKG